MIKDKFEKNRKCPKCDGTYELPVYCSGYNGFWKPKFYEYLEYRCFTCGYTLTTQTKDKK